MKRFILAAMLLASSAFADAPVIWNGASVKWLNSGNKIAGMCQMSSAGVQTVYTTDGIVKMASGVPGAAVAGTDYQAAGNYLTALTGDVTASGPGSAAATLATVNASPGTTAISTVTTNGKGLVTANTAASTTGSGNVVLATSPTLVTPALGTPTALVGTNITGTASGLTCGNVTTNADLTGVITSVGNATSIASQTGTGTKFVVDTSPTLVTPNLGTPTTLVGTNITGTAAGLTAGNVTTNANLTGVITSVGNATSTGAQTGTGNTFVMATAPTMTNPVVGTQSPGDNTTKAASTAFVTAAVSAAGGGCVIPVLTKTTDYTLLTGDFTCANKEILVEMNCTTACALTFVAASNSGYTVKMINIGTANATATLAGSDTYGSSEDTTWTLIPGGSPQSSNTFIANGGTRWAGF